MMSFEEALTRVVTMQLHEMEKRMSADFTALNASVADLKVKVEAVIAKLNTPPPDEQPAVDAVTAAVQAISAEIPSA